MNDHLSTDLLIDYAHGELRAEDDAFAHAHLASCGVCRAELDAERTFVDALRAGAAREEREFPGAVRAAIWKAVDAQRPSLADRIAAFVRPVVLAPVAVVAAALIAIAIPLGHGAAGTRVDAAYYLEAHAVQQAENPFADRGSAAAIETSMFDAADDTTTTAAVPAPASARTTTAAASFERLADVSPAGGLEVVR